MYNAAFGVEVNKVQAIKALRQQFPQLGLKQAHDLMKVVLNNVTIDTISGEQIPIVGSDELDSLLTGLDFGDKCRCSSAKASLAWAKAVYAESLIADVCTNLENMNKAILTGVDDDGNLNTPKQKRSSLGAVVMS